MRKILFMIICGIAIMGCSQEIEIKKSDPLKTENIIIDQEVKSEKDKISERDMISVPLVAQPVQVFFINGNKYFNYQPVNGDTLADISWAMWKGRYYYPEIIKIDDSIVDADLIYTHQIYMIPIIE